MVFLRPMAFKSVFNYSDIRVQFFSCEGAALEVQRWLCPCVCDQVEICLSSFKCQPLPFKTKHRTSLILCTLVQWQVNQLKTRLECVHHVNNEYKCTLNFINQSFCQLKVSFINREITLMDITIQCLLSSSQDPSKCLFWRHPLVNQSPRVIL